MEVRCRESNKDVIYMKGNCASLPSPHLCSSKLLLTLLYYTPLYSNLLNLILFYSTQLRRVHRHRLITEVDSYLSIPATLNNTQPSPLPSPLPIPFPLHLTFPLLCPLPFHSLCSLPSPSGALEVILPLCSNYIGLKGENIPMSPNATDRIQHHVRDSFPPSFLCTCSHFFDVVVMRSNTLFCPPSLLPLYLSHVVFFLRHVLLFNRICYCS